MFKSELDLSKSFTPLSIAVLAVSDTRTLETDTGTLAAVLWHGRLLQDAIAAGDAAVTGNKRAAARFVRLFRTPMT